MGHLQAVVRLSWPDVSIVLEKEVVTVRAEEGCAASGVCVSTRWVVLCQRRARHAMEVSREDEDIDMIGRGMF